MRNIPIHQDQCYLEDRLSQAGWMQISAAGWWRKEHGRKGHWRPRYWMYIISFNLPYKWRGSSLWSTLELGGLLSLQYLCFHSERRPLRENESGRVIALRGLSQGFRFTAVYHFPLTIISKEFYLQILFFLPLSLAQYMKSFRGGEHLLWGD